MSGVSLSFWEFPIILRGLWSDDGVLNPIVVMLPKEVCGVPETETSAQDMWGSWQMLQRWASGGISQRHRDWFRKARNTHSGENVGHLESERCRGGSQVLLLKGKLGEVWVWEGVWWWHQSGDHRWSVVVWASSGSLGWHGLHYLISRQCWKIP